VALVSWSVRPIAAVYFPSPDQLRIRPFSFELSSIDDCVERACGGPVLVEGRPEWQPQRADARSASARSLTPSRQRRVMMNAAGSMIRMAIHHSSVFRKRSVPRDTNRVR
jgi:hypothetical protein